jgi:cobalt-zinc-cadmium resistance protein CzcA
MLTGQKKLAKTSSTPGKTQLINHFIVNDQWYLVDLPGYGYAKVSKNQRNQWQKFISQYLLHRENLISIFVLIDARLEPQTIDLDFLTWCGKNNIPFAMIGGIIALTITGIPLSVSAAIGCIALFGQAVLNGVVMVTYYKQLQSEGMGLLEAVIQGSLTRLRTVLMTALLAMLGLFPMALSHAVGAETQRPLAVVVIGGLVSATLLTLLVLPTLYIWAARRFDSPKKLVPHPHDA